MHANAHSNQHTVVPLPSNQKISQNHDQFIQDKNTINFVRYAFSTFGFANAQRNILIFIRNLRNSLILIGYPNRDRC